MFKIVSSTTTTIKDILWFFILFMILFAGVISRELANAQTTETPNNSIPGTEIPNNSIPGTEIPDPGNPFNSCIFGCQQIPGSETKIINPNLSILNPDSNPEFKFTYSFINQLNISVSVSEEFNTNIFQARDIAQKIEKATGVKPAFVYISFVAVEILPESVSRTDKNSLMSIQENNKDEVEIILVTGKGNPIRYRIANVTKEDLLKVVDEFRTQIVAPQYRNRTSYLKPAQQLHKWLMKPIESDLQKYEINNLVFLLDAGLRSIPMAALHDGKKFLVEKYSIGLMPSLTLTNTLYTDIKKSEILAMGVSQSTQGQTPLPAVPVELRTIVTKLWSGKLLLNEQTTLENLKSLRRQKPFGIVHLATHANFTSGAIENSYIQLWENKLRLNQIRKLGLHQPQVEMLVISACRSALGNEEAEIGFAGLAVLAGVKTSVASLWSVDDTGTAALMTKFYESLKTAPIRADALRQAQIAMATGKVYLENGQLQGIKEIGSLPLPEESIQEPNQSLSHPYFWSGFTMVGNPW